MGLPKSERIARALTKLQTQGPRSVETPCLNAQWFRQTIGRAVMAIWGDWRTSAAKQDSERQEQLLKEAGC